MFGDGDLSDPQHKKVFYGMAEAALVQFFFSPANPPCDDGAGSRLANFDSIKAAQFKYVSSLNFNAAVSIMCVCVFCVCGCMFAVFVFVGVCLL